MANYCCAIRTNYFHVKDPDAFQELMKRVSGCEDQIEVWKENDSHGNLIFGFGLYGNIAGITDGEDEDIDETSYEKFISGLQKCVADDDAIIIFESGNEKLRYIIGSATVITSKSIKHLNLTALAVNKAARLLKNKSWTTRCNY